MMRIRKECERMSVRNEREKYVCVCVCVCVCVWLMGGGWRQGDKQRKLENIKVNRYTFYIREREGNMEEVS